VRVDCVGLLSAAFDWSRKGEEKMKKIAVVAVWVVSCVALAAESSRDFGQVAGYRRDGSGINPDAKPPVQFDFTKDLRWEAQIPCWGEGSPIVVGSKVLLMSEPAPGKYWPELVCYALADGKLLWRKELDSAEAMFPNDEAQRKDATETWRKWVDITRQSIELRWQYLDATDEAVKSALLAKLTGLGFKEDKRFGGAQLASHPLGVAAEKLGLSFGGWYPSYPTVIGIAYPTPVSDGKSIYVTTSHGLVASFDVDGNRQWLSYARVDLPKIKNCGCSMARSPILYKGLLISDVGDVVRAFDRQTGKLLWSDTTECDDIVSPGILTVPVAGGGKADVLWAAGGQAYRLPDGKRLQVDGWDGANNHGTLTLVKYDEPDVLFLAGEGEHCGWINKGKADQPPPAALRFALNGETLQATVLWCGVNGKAYSGASHSPNWCYYDGKLYFPGRRGVVFDALTGKVLKGDPTRDANKIVADAHHLLTVAGGHLYGFDGKNTQKASGTTPGAVLEVSSLSGGIVAKSTIPELPLNDVDREIIKYTSSQWKSGSKGWGTFAYSGSDTYTFGPDCIIIRGNSRLYCIGKEVTEGGEK
jgi:hypothetical protein